MKHSVHARSLASLVVALCLLAAPVAVLAKKGDKNYKRGLEAEKAKQWEQAAQEFALAVAANPSDMEFQLHYRRSLFNASQKFMEQGRTLSESGDYTGAYNAYRQAYGYDPVNELAQAEMGRMLRLQREKEEATGRSRTANGDSAAREGRIVRSSFDGANGANGAASAPAANTVRAAVAARAEQQQPPTRSEQLRVINYNGDLEGFVRKMSEELEFNVIFDRDFPKRTVSVNLRNVTAARALDHVFLAHNLFFQKLDRRTVLVADQSKRGQYQQLVLRTFYLTNIDPNNARTLIQSSLPPNSGRQAIVTPNKETNSITVRDTPENVRLIEQLVNSIDKERAEVVMDVNIYEVSRTDLLTLGNQIGDQNSLTGLGGLNPMQLLVGGPNGRGGVVDGGGTGGKGGGGTKLLADATTAATTVATAIGGSFLLPATRLSAFQSKDNTRLLAHTLVHAFDGEQSTTRIGQKVPVQTASVSPYGGVGTGTNTGTNTGAATNGLFGGGYPVIQYQDTGLILKFTPQVFPNQDVQVKMEIESNDVIGASTALTPTFSQRSVAGMARIPNNRTMMIASVAQDKESRGRQGLPLLGLIPVLGRLFSTPTRNDSNNDIVITVTPRVLRAPTITPNDIRQRESGTLQAPVSDTLEAVVRDAEREDQLAAARLLPTDVNVQLPAAPAAAETASAQTPAAAAPAGPQPTQTNAPTADAEQPTFVPAPKILAAGGGAATAHGFATPEIHVEDVPPPAAKPVVRAPAVSTAPAVSASAPAATFAATGSVETSAATALAGAELYVVAGGGSEMRVGQRQRLMIFVKTGTPLALAAATLKFDPRLLAVRSVTGGSIFGEGAAAAKPSITQSGDTPGQMLALVAPPAGSHVTGMGVLLFVEVEALAAGVSAVGFERAGVHLMAADGRGVAARVAEIRLTVK